MNAVAGTRDSQPQTAQWYFDFISPFAYLQLQRLAELPVARIEYRPILFAGLLNHWGQLGPAEIEPKRRFTYRYVTWSAQRQGIDLRMPPAHPFHPLKVLRLCLALESRPEIVQTIFNFIWREGRDPNQDWSALCEQLGLSADEGAQRISADTVKDQLRRNTQSAIAAGVYGVPTVVINGEAFWGADATDMAGDYVRNPELFESTEMQRIAELPVASERPRG